MKLLTVKGNGTNGNILIKKMEAPYPHPACALEKLITDGMRRWGKQQHRTFPFRVSTPIPTTLSKREGKQFILSIAV